MDRVPEPVDGDERTLLLGWLAFLRDALAAKCAGLTPDQLTFMSVPPSDLTLLGLVRHLTEMERVYLVYALGGGELRYVYGPYDGDGPDRDIEELEPAMAEDSFDNWHAERDVADELIAAAPSLDAPGAGNGRSVRWNLLKVLHEYARHMGHADLDPPDDRRRHGRVKIVLARVTGALRR